MTTSLSSIAHAKDRGKHAPYALIFGTVFRNTGVSLRGAEVILVPNRETGRTTKVKTIRAVSDGRGEFAFRVPAAPGKYSIRAHAEGYAPQEKTVSITGDERMDVSFSLEPAR